MNVLSGTATVPRSQLISLRIVVVRLARSPLALTIAALLVTFVAIRPWGNYPLNDDWTYAHLAKRFAETGVVKIDVPLAPNALGQALLGALVVKVFGFSHTALRVLTLLVACVGLWAMNALMRHATPRRPLRLMGLLLLAFNPLYFYSATTYMNELYGWVPALLGAVLWFWDRQRLASDGSRVISFWVAILTGLLTGATFWTRQLCVLVYPALLAGTVGRHLLLGRWRALARSLPALLGGTVVFAGTIYAFFGWARATGNLRPEFASRIDNLWKFDSTTYQMQVGSALVYMTAFFLPLLAMASWSSARRWMLHLGAVAFVVVGLLTKDLFETHATTDFWIGPLWAHRVFPFVVNIIYNAGLGPITLDDVFFYDVAKPQWSKFVWTTLEFFFIAAGALWSPLGASLARAVAAARRSWSAEVLLFALALVLGSLFAIVQAHQGEIVDRYYLPVVLGLAVLVPGTLAWTKGPVLSRYDVAKFSLLFCAIAGFSACGAHDQFRWNDARWQLIGEAMRQGGTRATVQGGWEPNCWFRHEGLTAAELACEGGCRCAMSGFCCVDDRWRIGMSVSAGYRRVASIRPSYWLASGPDVVLSRRDVP